MKIQLEQEDVRWATTICPPLGNIRWLAVKVGGKLFHVRRELDPMSAYMDHEAAKAEIDKLLLREMEIMLAKTFRDACEAVPDGEVAIR